MNSTVFSRILHARNLAGFLAAALLISSTAPARANAAAEAMAAAANHFLNALSPEQKAKASFELKDDERLNWHFIPKDRNGLTIKEMSPAQRQLAHVLLNSGMSHDGYAKAVTIMSLEHILWELENKAPRRDAELYYFSIFGKPGSKAAWGWRVEGHHLSINFTIVDGRHVSATPSFFGTNPAEVRSGPRQGLRVLGIEEELGRDLVKSLNAEQKKQAIFDTKAPSDIITGSQRKVKPLEPAGLSYTRLNGDQKEMLQKLVREYVNRHRGEVAAADLEKIQKAGWDKVSFAWAGGVERGEGHYYRVQGPTFLMEYDNTQGNANHVHCVFRDFESDFGEDLLRKHYDQAHR